MIKVKFSENNSGVNAEVVVEGEESDKTLELAKELFDEAQDFAKLKTLQKQI